MSGCITNIQKYCTHDGPGIRDVVFMKGCPLRCIWCSNPETQRPEPQLAYSSKKCIGCGNCVRVCQQGAIEVNSEGGMRVDRKKCTACFRCVAGCHAKALHRFGDEMTVQEVYEKTRHKHTWRVHGGVTVSGGEPLQQADFVAGLLKKHKSYGAHTALETTGFAPWNALEKVVSYCDLVYYDVKMLNANNHIKYTGVDNKLILDNLKKVAARFPSLELIVRTPVIPGINDSKEELWNIAKGLSGLAHLSDYELLPYHGFGSSKYEQLGIEYQLREILRIDKKKIEDFNKDLRKSLAIPN